MNYIKQIITVTRWEYSRFFKPKNEAIGLIIMLLLSAALYFGGKYALSESIPEINVFVLNDNNGTLTEILKNNFTVRQLASSEKDIFIKGLNENKNNVLLDIKNGTIELYAYKNNKDIKKLKTYLDIYHQQIEMQKLGLSAEQLASVLSPASTKETFIIKDNSSNRLILSYFFAGLMILAVFLSFAYQFTAITGEKQLRITEQIVSAISPQVWMDGKILGITLTGISSMITYSLLFILGGIIYFQFTGASVLTILEYLHFPSIALFLPFALIGVLIWNAILAAIASVITDPNNSSKSSLMMLPAVFVMASFLVTRDPDSGLSVFLSWFPLTSATSMPMRWAITEVGIWQLIGSFLILLLTFYLLRKIAAKIFRVSILLTGKEPSWSEVYKFVKMK
ncbi:ABC transporter permease [Ignavibacteria bacterium 4148-Me]|uniref:ABC transporter permease n=1 Tax=Rosettibacter primus TaxID=3111523 RepID=UPI00336BEE09